MSRPEVRCSKCGFRLPRVDAPSVRCPVCDQRVAIPEVTRPHPPLEQEELFPTWLKNLGRLAVVMTCGYVWVQIELANTEPVHIPQPVQIPRLPERLTHPDASPEECARVREVGGECASYSVVRTCDDAGVMTEELCGLGAWPCVRDGCGPGTRCCVPGTFDAAPP
jgi:hypothetical protein